MKGALASHNKYSVFLLIVFNPPMKIQEVYGCQKDLQHSALFIIEAVCLFDKRREEAIYEFGTGLALKHML